MKKVEINIEKVRQLSIETLKFMKSKGYTGLEVYIATRYLEQALKNAEKNLDQIEQPIAEALERMRANAKAVN